jgi:hypothetical protein
MRFLPDTPDIPTALIKAVESGNAVFLCGAGVSMRSNMPSFKSLAAGIYADLNEVWTNAPAERIAIDRREYDRALRSLEKRTLLPRVASPVRAATTRLLTSTGGVKTTDHLSLLRLSQNREGRPRILTTNFDTLFERAALEAGMTDVPSHCGRSMPKPGTQNDYGILHLHGRIEDKTLGFTPSDMILTSADFGDAYLRDGWASRYIEDRMRIHTLILVGYQAEDAAMRLLLETLDADRERFSDLKDIYAIEKSSDGSASVWEAKGIKPIEYSSYDAIYKTLAEWARYSQDPTAYSRNLVRSILTELK